MSQQQRAIILYDTPVALPGEQRAHSPNVWKARLVLNYKRIPYTTTWISYGSIQRVLPTLGISPTTTYADGTPKYTLPAIHDPNTGVVIADSLAIAEYLDTHYPSRPVLAPSTDAGRRDDEAAFANSAIRLLFPEFNLIGLHGTYLNLPVADQPAMERLIQSMDNGPSISSRRWSKLADNPDLGGVIACLGRLAKALDDLSIKQGEEKTLGFPIFVAAAFLIFFQRAVGEDNMAPVLEADNGRWGKLLEDVKEYTAVDVGEVYVESA